MRLAGAWQLTEPLAFNEQVKRGIEFFAAQAVAVNATVNLAGRRFRPSFAFEPCEHATGGLCFVARAGFAEHGAEVIQQKRSPRTSGAHGFRAHRLSGRIPKQFEGEP